jgi:hypothetical protein
MRAGVAVVVVAGASFAIPACLIGFPTDPDSGADAGSDAAADVASPSVGRYPTAVLQDAPIVYLRLGEASGRVAKNEVGGGQYTYTPQGVAYGTPGALAGDPDTAITFAGGTAAIVMEPGAEFVGKAPFSVEVWFEPAPANTAPYAFVVDHQAYTPARRGWFLSLTNSELRLDRWNDGAGDTTTTTSPGADGAWHHLVATFDGAALALFLDGVPLPPATSGVAIDQPTSVAYTVANQNCDKCTNAYVGALDELAIYDKALSLDRVRAHYAAAK